MGMQDLNIINGLSIVIHSMYRIYLYEFSN